MRRALCWMTIVVAIPSLEVGDPEEGDSNYGGFPYTLHGFTYNLQDLVMLLTASVLSVNFLVDVSYRLLDPRIRASR